MSIQDLTRNYWHLANAWRRRREPQFKEALERLLQQSKITDKLRTAIQGAIAS